MFLWIVIITLCALWLLGQAGRWWLRRWVARNPEEFARRFGGYPGGGARSGTANARGRQSHKEGEVTVEQTIHVEKKVSTKVGDYVEFEEVEITEETIDE